MIVFTLAMFGIVLLWLATEVRRMRQVMEADWVEEVPPCGCLHRCGK